MECRFTVLHIRVLNIVRQMSFVQLLDIIF